MQTNTGRIPLTQGKFAIVDLQDYRWLMQWKWCAVKKGLGRWYAVRTEYTPSKSTSIRMHREIAKRAGLSFSKEYDHIDNDGLNNRRSNLRVANRHQQCWNRKKRQPAASRFKGVYWQKSAWKWKWIARIYVRGKRFYLGHFEKEEDAGKAYQEAAIKHFGEFARF